jgi:hypothetical protein
MDSEQSAELAEASPLLRQFHDGWHEAAEKYAQYPQKFTAEHDDTTAAVCIRRHMFHEIMRRFDGQPGCRVQDIRGLKVLVYKDRQVWRFKKLNSAGRHSNYPTQQQEDFDDQWPLPNIPPEATRLTSGYMLDASGQAMERIVVSRVLGRDVKWVAQTVMLDGTFTVRDITPSRIPGTERMDFEARAARGRRRPR